MIDRVLSAVREAGALIQQRRAEGLDVHHKAGHGPVTDADRAADAYLREHLPRIRDAGWLSEETADNRDRLGRDAVWVVDPLDGTIEFVEGRDEYSVSVALVEQERPVLSAVHCPASGVTVWALRDEGVWRNGDPVHVSEGQTLLASRTELARGEFAPFDADWEIRPSGSIAWKLALIACGDAAGTLSRGPKWEWDVCGGALLVEAAGGLVTDLFGDPLRFNQRHPKVRGIIAAAPKGHSVLRRTIDTIGPSDRMAELGH